MRSQEWHHVLQVSTCVFVHLCVRVCVCLCARTRACVCVRVCVCVSAHELKFMVAKVVQDQDNQRCLEGTKDLEVQGRFFKILSDSPHSQIDYWSKAVWSLPAKQMTFAVNSAQDMLPHNSNLRRWKRPVAPSCLLCGDLQTLRHVLNGCLRPLQKSRYDARHN